MPLITTFGSASVRGFRGAPTSAPAPVNCVEPTSVTNITIGSSSSGAFTYQNAQFTGTGPVGGGGSPAASLRATLTKSGFLNYEIYNMTTSGAQLAIFKNDTLFDYVDFVDLESSFGNISVQSTDVILARMYANNGQVVNAGVLYGSFSISCP